MAAANQEHAVTESLPPPSDSAESDRPLVPTPSHRFALTVLATCAVIVLLRYMQEVLIPLVLAALTFYALDPLVDRLERWRIPRALGAAVLLFGVVAGAGAVAFSLRDEVAAVAHHLPDAVKGLRANLRESRADGPGALDSLREAASQLDAAAQEAAGESAPQKGVMRVRVEGPGIELGTYLRWGAVGALSFAAGLVMILFLAYFLLVTDDLFKRKLIEAMGPTLARKKVTLQVLNQIAQQIELYLKVQIFTSMVVGLATWGALWWIGLDNAAVWGLCAGLLNSIPYFGPLIVTAGLTAIAYVQFGTVGMAVTVAGSALVITTLEGWVLTPLLMSRVSQINTVSIFAALLFWSWMWGVWGLLLAVPITMTIKAVCDRVEGWQQVGALLGE